MCIRDRNDKISTFLSGTASQLDCWTQAAQQVKSDVLAYEAEVQSSILPVSERLDQVRIVKTLFLCFHTELLLPAMKAEKIFLFLIPVMCCIVLPITCWYSIVMLIRFGSCFSELFSIWIQESMIYLQWPHIDSGCLFRNNTVPILSRLERRKRLL